MSNLDKLLGGLSGVRKTGRGKYQAKCPAHDDKSPSLAITETQDGVILIHCFSGCAVHDIVEVVGMELSDLFSERIEKTENERAGHKKLSNPFPAADILDLLLFEATILSIGASNIVTSGTLSIEDSKRMELARYRIDCAIEVCQCR